MVSSLILKLFGKLLSVFSSFFASAWLVLKIWWWIFIPFILWKPFSFLYLWWRQSCFYKENKFVLFEIKVPKEMLKPIRAMETVIDHLWQILYDPPGNWWENWIEGKILFSYSFEIALIEGQIHFFIRGLESHRHSIEAAIYSQFPEVEISIVDDYTKRLPADIPNKDWDLWGADYRLLKNSAYPIRTYKDFETEREASEERKIDPMANLFEAAAKVGPGEQIWIQITAGPVTDADYPWISEAKKIRDKLVGRKEPSLSRKPMIMEAADILISGKPSEEKKPEKEIIPTEMKLTPGEKELVSKIEQKISKRGFKTNIRFIYLGKRDVFFKPKIRLPLSFFSAFNTECNSLVPYGQPFIAKIVKSWFLPLNLIRNRRTYLRKRALFRKYKSRVDPFYPKEEPFSAKKKAIFVLNTEEIASLFHFPGKRVAPAPFIERIETRKREAPPGLPTE
jgi:hypothetical protein